MHLMQSLGRNVYFNYNMGNKKDKKLMLQTFNLTR